MREILEEIIKQIENYEIKSAGDTETFRITFLSKKGKINELFEQFKQVSPEVKKETGLLLNQLKQKTQQKWEESIQLFNKENKTTHADVDLTLPADAWLKGSRHPLSIIENKVIEIFSSLGFVYAEGPEIEDDWHNFSALNFPQNHPARDMQDTFFITKDISLRTHTSSVQVRLMESQKPPIRAIMPGRVYRNEAISARANCFFHQVEGIYIDKQVSFADLKQTLYYFVQQLFGNNIQVRFRPSYFPFTEPSAEMDISCMLCNNKGCNVCKHTGWLEILGCGMIDPNVLKASNINPKEYTGYAFGMGIERIAMLKYDIKDLRTYFNNDIRFLNQFGF